MASKIEKVLLDGSKILDSALKKELRDQGHSLTGALERSIGGAATSSGDVSEVVGLAFDYGVILHFGTSSARIPYGGVSTGATTSAYIQGLYQFWKAKGLSDKEALSAAFATARKQKAEGMPTRNSYTFSRNGYRTDFLDHARATVEKKMDQEISSGIDQIVNQRFLATKSETI